MYQLHFPCTQVNKSYLQLLTYSCLTPTASKNPWTIAWRAVVITAGTHWEYPSPPRQAALTACLHSPHALSLDACRKALGISFLFSHNHVFHTDCSSLHTKTSRRNVIHIEFHWFLRMIKSFAGERSSQSGIPLPLQGIWQKKRTSHEDLNFV